MFILAAKTELSMVDRITDFVLGEDKLGMQNLADDRDFLQHP